jgi:hypothetical protein
MLCPIIALEWQSERDELWCQPFEHSDLEQVTTMLAKHKKKGIREASHRFKIDSRVGRASYS